MKAKGGGRRLYLTTPDAYIQQTEDGCTWDDLKDLARQRMQYDVHSTETNDQLVTEQDSCWDYQPALDYATDADKSFASRSSHVSRWSTRSQPSDNGNHQEGVGSEKDAQPRSPSSTSRSLNIHRHTTELPAPTVDAPVIVKGKRRTASAESANLESKRRRTSEISEVYRHGQMATPRLSREPPSPFVSENHGEGRSQATSAAHRRGGNTPMAYATPHSNTVDTVYLPNGDGDTEADTEIARNSDRGEIEWEGVGDDDLPPSSATSERRLARGHFDARSESELSEDDPDEGLTIYEE